MEQRFISKIMQAMLMLLPCITFTACGDDDEPKNPEQAIWTTSYEVSFNLSDEVFKLTDINQ